MLYLIEHATPAKPRRKRVAVSSSTMTTNGSVAPPIAPPSAPQSGYEATGDRLIWHKPAGDQLVPTTLANFDARIIGEILKDDGIDKRRFYELTVTRKDQSCTFTVAATQFDSLVWVAEQLGAEHMVYAAGESRSTCPWRSKLYLGTSRGARCSCIPAGGPWKVSEFTCTPMARSTPAPRVKASGSSAPPELGEYRLPAPPHGSDLIQALRASRTFLDVAPLRITVPLFLTGYRAVLGEANFSVFVYGESGGRKTSLAAIIQQHFGAAMDFDYPPANWMSTANYNGGPSRTLPRTRSCWWMTSCVGGPRDIQRLHAEADRLFRGQANRQGRGRLQSDSTMRGGRKPRGVPIGTGEELPRGASLQARMLALLVESGEVNLVLLSQLQDLAARGLFAAAMSGFIRYAGEHFEEFQQQRREQSKHVRQAAAKTTAHGRGVAIRGELAFTANVLARFYVDSGDMTETEATAWLDRIHGALEEVAQNGSRRTKRLISRSVPWYCCGRAQSRGATPFSPISMGSRRKTPRVAGGGETN